MSQVKVKKSDEKLDQVVLLLRASGLTSAMRKEMHERGLGGWLKPETGVSLCSGWEIARALARDFANFSSSKMGRGSEFRDCIRALKEKGF